MEGAVAEGGIAEGSAGLGGPLAALGGRAVEREPLDPGEGGGCSCTSAGGAGRTPGEEGGWSEGTLVPTLPRAGGPLPPTLLMTLGATAVGADTAALEPEREINGAGCRLLCWGGG